jgi:Tfp pilus assembly major pilin PilA
MDIGAGTGLAAGLPRRQRGLTILGFMLVAAVVVIFAMVGFRVVPSYIEYFSVKRALEDTMRGGTADPNNPAAFRSELARRLQTSYVEEVKATDAILTRQGTQVVAEMAWERRLHLVGNMYILLEFEATSSR